MTRGSDDGDTAMTRPTPARVTLSSKAQRLTLPSNAPYEPLYYPEIAGVWRRLLARFLKFCEWVPIDAKEQGATRLILLESQRYVIEEIFVGLSLGLHDFVIVKARQLGASTVLWALDLFWLMTFPGLQGMYVSDDEGNKEKHRRLISAMYLGLMHSNPTLTRGPWLYNNKWGMEWASSPTWRSSRLDWAFVNRRAEGRLGIGRGINVLHGTEIDTWDDEEGVNSMQAALAREHPFRLYLYEGTGRGYGLLHQMWTQAEDSVSTRRIFLAFWRHAGFQVDPETQPLVWAAYGEPEPLTEEKEWIIEAERRYAPGFSRERWQRHLAFFRFACAEEKGLAGDQQKALEKYPWLPEHAFQALGKSFISPRTCLRISRSIEDAPHPTYYVYDWGAHFDSKADGALIELPEEQSDAATLTVWEEPEPGMVYVLGADPAYGSSPTADRYAAILCKAFPDALIQVAEYVTPLGEMYKFAWVLVHLCGTYRIEDDTFWSVDVNGPGRAVDEEITRMANYGFGISKPGQRTVQDVMNGMRRFIERRTDSMTEAPAWHFHSTTEFRIQMFQQLRDSVERGALVIRSPALAAEIASLRQERSGRVEAGGIAKDDLAFAAGLANRVWLQNVIPEIEDRIAPLTPPRNAPHHQGERMLRRFLGALRPDSPTASVSPPYGLPRIGPGRGAKP